MAISIDQLRAAYQNKNASRGEYNNNYYRFFDMKTGEQATVRFLPDKNTENPLGFLVEKVQHNLEINGETKVVPCLSMYGQECPICNVSREYYNAGDDVNGKKYWKKRQHIGQVVVIDDPIPNVESDDDGTVKVKLINIGYQLYNVIKEAFESGDLDEVPCDYENGYNFIIKKTKQGKWDSYAMGSKFARKVSSLPDEIIDEVEPQLVDLATLLPKNPGVEKVEQMLDASLTGEAYREPEDGGYEEIEEEVKPAPKPRAAKPKAAPKKAKPVTVESDDEEDDDSGSGGEVDDLLARIRQRNSG